jgi:glycosyltransferase involved in cell wall biosynthesis
MIDVSVVIATHNRAVQVRQAIDSVLGQSVPVREVIVVDDGSTDDTRTQLAAYGNSIRVLHQENAGASAARNRAFQSARAAWIAFLDDDDVWLKSKIERQMALIEHNPRIGLIYCSDYAVDEQLRILYPRNAAPENRGDVFERLIVKNFIFTSCVIARRDLIERADGMNPAYRFAEDWDLWLKIAATHTVDFVPEPLVWYRQSAAGCLTQETSMAERLRDMETILTSAIKLRRLPRSVERRAWHDLEVQWAATFLNQGTHARAVWHALQATALRPQSRKGYQVLLNSMMPKRVREWVKQAVLVRPASLSTRP